MYILFEFKFSYFYLDYFFMTIKLFFNRFNFFLFFMLKNEKSIFELPKVAVILKHFLFEFPLRKGGVVVMLMVDTFFHYSFDLIF